MKRLLFLLLLAVSPAQAGFMETWNKLGQNRVVAGIKGVAEAFMAYYALDAAVRIHGSQFLDDLKNVKLEKDRLCAVLNSGVQAGGLTWVGCKLLIDGFIPNMEIALNTKIV